MILPANRYFAAVHQAQRLEDALSAAVLEALDDPHQELVADLAYAPASRRVMVYCSEQHAEMVRQQVSERAALLRALGLAGGHVTVIER